ncbi:MAG: hypothetical protein AAFR47_18525 [Pseudomonadota bacterium]
MPLWLQSLVKELKAAGYDPTLTPAFVDLDPRNGDDPRYDARLVLCEKANISLDWVFGDMPRARTRWTQLQRRRSKQWDNRTLTSAPVAALLHAGYLRQLSSWGRLGTTETVLRAREWLTDATMRARLRRGYKLTAQTRLVVVPRAWNACVRGTTPQRIQATGRLPQVL